MSFIERAFERVIVTGSSKMLTSEVGTAEHLRPVRANQFRAWHVGLKAAEMYSVDVLSFFSRLVGWVLYGVKISILCAVCHSLMPSHWMWSGFYISNSHRLLLFSILSVLGYRYKTLELQPEFLSPNSPLQGRPLGSINQNSGRRPRTHQIRFWRQCNEGMIYKGKHVQGLGSRWGILRHSATSDCGNWEPISTHRPRWKLGPQRNGCPRKFFSPMDKASRSKCQNRTRAGEATPRTLSATTM